MVCIYCLQKETKYTRPDAASSTPPKKLFITTGAAEVRASLKINKIKEDMGGTLLVEIEWTTLIHQLKWLVQSHDTSCLFT